MFTANTSALDKLRKKQKHAIRAICNANYRARTAPSFQELNILPIDQLFMHSYHFKQLTLSFSSTWLTNEDANDLFVPAHRVEFVKSLPLFSFPVTWNSAPGHTLNPRNVK